MQRRVAYILDGSTAVTGALVSAREIARALDGDVEVTLVLSDTAEIPAEALADFAAVRRVAIRPLRRSLRAVLGYFPFLCVAAVQLRLLMWRDGARCLIVNDFYLMQGVLLRLLAFRGRILTWVRIDPAAFGRIARLWIWAAARASDRLVAVSRHIRSLLPGTVYADVLYNPVSGEFLARAPDSATSDRSFVFVGNYIQGKGQDVALEALARVLKEIPDARLEFHGGDMGRGRNRAYRTALEERAEDLGIREAVHFGGFSADPRRVMSGKLAALNLSRSESFSRTVLEASASGLPVIATRCGGPEEIIVEGRTGFLVPVGDAEACACRMIELCQSPATARRMGEAGRDHVMSSFSPAAFRDRLRALLEL
jgi:glycosyltransferase involved in cell wall biosynthesis